MNMVEIKDLVCRYGDIEALRGIALSVPAGGMVGVVGPNGAGKSTLLKVLSGIITRYAGSVTVTGHLLSEMSGVKRARVIGYVAQENSAFLDYRVKELIRMGRYPHHRPFEVLGPSDLEACARAARETGITELENRSLNELSSGERQRVMIARVLAQEPGLILLDEPTSHLDLHHQHAIMELVRRLNQGGMTVIVVVHDLNLASLYCRQIILLHEGVILASGTPAETITPGNLAAVYPDGFRIIPHPEHGVPQVLMP